MSSESYNGPGPIIARTIVTIGIWGVLFVIIEKITQMEVGNNADLRVLPIVIGIVAVSIITMAIWVGEIMASRGDRQHTKAKNQGYDNAPAQLLLSLLSDEERQQLRSRLMNNLDDGEMVGLDDMMAYQRHEN